MHGRVRVTARRGSDDLGRCLDCEAGDHGAIVDDRCVCCSLAVNVCAHESWECDDGILSCCGCSVAVEASIADADDDGALMAFKAAANA